MSPWLWTCTTKMRVQMLVAPPSTHSGLRPKPWAGSKAEVVPFPEPLIRPAVGWQLSAVPTAAGRLVSACLDRYEVSLDRHQDDCDANSSIGPAGCCSTCCIHETPADFAPRTGGRSDLRSHSSRGSPCGCDRRHGFGFCRCVGCLPGACLLDVCRLERPPGS